MPIAMPAARPLNFEGGKENNYVMELKIVSISSSATIPEAAAKTSRKVSISSEARVFGRTINGGNGNLKKK
jgi:hypothetical protein